MGRIRSLSAQAHPQSELVEIVDTVAEQARSLAAERGCRAGTDWQRLLEREDVDAVVVATPHKYLVPVTTAALNAGKHVFCEKPGGRNSVEAEIVLRTVCRDGSAGEVESGVSFLSEMSPRLIVGFTLRHYPAIVRAHALVMSGVIGEPMYVRGRYGHGGRPDYDLEWRGDLEMAGGGELLDQGVHLIDLSRWFLGEFKQVSGSVSTYFWRSRQNVSKGNLEDNAFLSLRTETGRTAWLHASWTQWKNLFSFEIYGTEGFIQVNGLGGHYGPQQMQVARRHHEGGLPEVQETDFAANKGQGGQDDVWSQEWAAFVSCVVERNESADRNPSVFSARAVDAWQALKIVDAAYEASSKGTSVLLQPSSVHVCTATSSRK